MSGGLLEESQRLLVGTLPGLLGIEMVRVEKFDDSSVPLQRLFNSVNNFAVPRKLVMCMS